MCLPLYEGIVLVSLAVVTSVVSPADCFRLVSDRRMVPVRSSVSTVSVKCLLMSAMEVPLGIVTVASAGASHGL